MVADTMVRLFGQLMCVIVRSAARTCVPKFPLWLRKIRAASSDGVAPLANV
jgi:hypothetical protein